MPVSYCYITNHLETQWHEITLISLVSVDFADLGWTWLGSCMSPWVAWGPASCISHFPMCRSCANKPHVSEDFLVADKYGLSALTY